MAASKYKLIIWDWNGTLYADRDISLMTVNYILDKRGMPPITLEQYYSYVDTPITRFYEHLFDMSKVSFDEIDEAVSLITDSAHPDATVIFGYAFDSTLEDEMRITLIATGFEQDKKSYEFRKAVAEKQSTAEPTPEQVVADKTNANDEIDNIISLLNSNRRTDY